MKTVTEGHRYELENMEGSAPQILQFIHKERVAPDETKLRTVNDGTTNEEVLRVLIDRMQTQGAKLPCRENSIATTKLQEALMWLEKRTADRVARGAEGTMQK